MEIDKRSNLEHHVTEAATLAMSDSPSTDSLSQTVNTIRPPEIEHTKTSQLLVPVDTPLSVIRKHIPR